MTKQILDYSEIKNKLLSFLANSDNAVMILSTSANDVVMSRPVLIINNNLELYFFTWKHSRKYHQIEINNRISLCKDKVEIEGCAEILGLLTNKRNKEILEIIRRKHPKAIEKWKNKSSMVIIKIIPVFACIDGYFIDDEAYLEYIDFEKHSAYREKWGYF